MSASVAVRVSGTSLPDVERLLEALDNSARIGKAAGVCVRLVVVLDDAPPGPLLDDAAVAGLRARFAHLDDIACRPGGCADSADYVVTAGAGVVPDARALWRMLAAFTDPAVGAVEARLLPIELPTEPDPGPAFVMTPGTPTLQQRERLQLAAAVVFRDERWTTAVPEHGGATYGEGFADATPVGQWLTRWGLDVTVPPAYEVEPGRPFLTVVMRTQGRRLQEMREALLSLAAQTSDDFEVLVVAHRTTAEELRSVEELVEDQPASLRERIRVLSLDRGGRSAPLNLGLEEARGRYVGVFDDDDIVLAHWVEAFAAAERRGPGRVLRSVVLVQEMESQPVDGLPGVRASGPLLDFYAPRFSLVQHLAANQSPTLGWVVPHWLVGGAGVRFDESLTTTEDWEFLVRAAELAGVTDTEQATSIYRRYGERESSRNIHPIEEWRANQDEIERRLDARPLLLPAGESRGLRSDYLRLRELEKADREQRRALRRRARHIAQLRADVVRLEGELAALRASGAGLRARGPRAVLGAWRRRLRGN